MSSHTTRRISIASPRPTLLLAVCVCALLAVGCGQKVMMIDLHDPVVPIESRRLVADAQDAVSVARARLDESRREVERVEQWRTRYLEEVEWPDPAQSARDELRALADARLELVELERERAEVNLDLAEHKYVLVRAKVAVRHDLAVYELEPIRQRVDEDQKRADELTAQIEKQYLTLDELNRKWWKTYNAYAKKHGRTGFFY